ncbi:MAG: DUF2812 domain-containing protein [Flexilinea sp.]|nr:DUF2812 domain-containing protein [Flexilinea sp.]
MHRFILLLNHDDISLSAYLKHCLANGEQFIKASSNIFTFRKCTPSDERIVAVTYINKDPNLKMKFQMEDYSALMKKRGWQVLYVGGPENIFDSKRHVFLQTEMTDIPDPEIDPELGVKARKREKRSLIRCLTMLLLLVGFTIFFLGHDPDIFLSSNHIFFPCTVAAVMGITSLVFCVMGGLAILRKAQCSDGFKHFLCVDKAVLFCMLSVFGLVAALALDLIRYPDKGRIIVSDEQRITIYHDDVPLKMEDLSIPVEGAYRSSRLTERNGLLMSGLYASDQSFSDGAGTGNSSMIFYSVFRSDWETGLKWVLEQKGINRFPLAEELNDDWHSDEVRTDGHHILFARYPGAILMFSTSTELADVDPDIVLDKLHLKNGS